MIQHKVTSNGRFSLLKSPYSKDQHPNQQGGLDQYVDVLAHTTGNVNVVKLYKNTKGLYFKKQGNWYLHEFTKTYIYTPYQIQEMT